MPSAKKNKEEYMYRSKNGDAKSVKLDDKLMAGAAVIYWRGDISLLVMSHTEQTGRSLTMPLKNVVDLDSSKDENGFHLHFCTSGSDPHDPASQQHHVVLPSQSGGKTNSCQIIYEEVRKLCTSKPWNHDHNKNDLAQKYPDATEAAAFIGTAVTLSKPKKSQISSFDSAYNQAGTLQPKSKSRGSQGDAFAQAANNPTYSSQSAAVANFRSVTTPHPFYTRPTLTLQTVGSDARPGDRSITRPQAYRSFDERSAIAKQQDLNNARATQFNQTKHQHSAPVSVSSNSATKPHTAYSIKSNKNASPVPKNQPAINSYMRTSSYNQPSFKPVIRGELRGMRNLGNSCYINSVVQALFAQPCFAYDLAELCLSKSSSPDPNHLTPIPIDSTSVYSHLVSLREERMKPDHGVSETRTLKYALDSAFRQFVGYRQQDAHEFLTETFNRLNEDILTTFVRKWRLDHNLPSNSPSPRHTSHVIVEDDDFDRIMADQISHKDKENDSPVEQIETSVTAPSSEELQQFESAALEISPVQRNFHCEIKVNLICANPECQHERSNIEHFNVLSLDLLTSRQLDHGQSTLDQHFAPSTNKVPDYLRATVMNSSKLALKKPVTPLPRMSIECLLRDFFKETEREYRCEKCKHAVVRIQSKINRLPRVLVLHIKRFATDDGITIKKRNDIVTVGEELDLSFACDPAVQRPDLVDYPANPEWVPSKLVDVDEIVDDDEPIEQSGLVFEKKPIANSILGSIGSVKSEQDTVKPGPTQVTTDAGVCQTAVTVNRIPRKSPQPLVDGGGAMHSLIIRTPSTQTNTMKKEAFIAPTRHDELMVENDYSETIVSTPVQSDPRWSSEQDHHPTSSESLVSLSDDVEQFNSTVKTEQDDAQMNEIKTPSSCRRGAPHKRKIEAITPRLTQDTASKRPRDDMPHVNPFRVIEPELSSSQPSIASPSSSEERWADDNEPSSASQPRANKTAFSYLRSKLENFIDKYKNDVAKIIKQNWAEPERRSALVNFKRKSEDEIDEIVKENDERMEGILAKAASDLERVEDDASKVEEKFCAFQKLQETCLSEKKLWKQMIADALQIGDTTRSSDPGALSSNNQSIDHSSCHSNNQSINQSTTFANGDTCVKDEIDQSINQTNGNKEMDDDDMPDLDEKERAWIKSEAAEKKKREQQEEEELKLALAASMAEGKMDDEDLSVNLEDVDAIPSSLPNSPPLLPKIEVIDDDIEHIVSPACNDHSQIQARYKLTAVVIHRGVSSSSGHYVTDVLEQEKGQPVWRQYDDQYVIRHTDKTQMMAQWAKEGYIFFFQLQP